MSPERAQRVREAAAVMERMPRAERPSTAQVREASAHGAAVALDPPQGQGRGLFRATSRRSESLA